MKPIVSTSAALLVAGVSVLIAQDRLKLMPGYDQYSRMAPQLQNAFVSNAVQGVRWADDGRSFTYAVAGDRFSFDLASMTSTPLASAPTPANEA